MDVQTYQGQTLCNVLVTYKIDGVRVHNTEGKAVSRSGKPLHNITLGEWSVAEVFLGTWEASVSACRTHNGKPITASHIYELQPNIDKRLVVESLVVMTSNDANALLQAALLNGYEGLVYISNGKMYKHKPISSYDEMVIGYVEGKGKHLGRLGKLITDKGGVGTGFTDKERDDLWRIRNTLIGKAIIEVEAMSLTPQGKFRHPRFIRRREDKE